MEEIETGIAEIFNAAIELLREHGSLNKDKLIFKYKVIEHTVNSAKPPVKVVIAASANLDKARLVYAEVEGQNLIQVYKSGKKGHERFKGVYIDSSGHEFDFIRFPGVAIGLSSGYRGVLNLLKGELSSK